MTKKEKQAIYNAEPVFYCEDCLSLNIVTMDKTYNYCAKCGSFHTDVCFIDDWTKKYIERYKQHPLH